MDDKPIKDASATRTGGRAAVGVLLGGLAIVAFLVGRAALSAVVTVFVVAAYAELRRILQPHGRTVTLLAGAAAVVGAMWSGYAGRLTWLPWIAAGLVLVLLVSKVIAHEITGALDGATSDVAATLTAASVAGVLGAHVPLIRAAPHFGFGATLAFGLMVFGNDAFAFFVGRLVGRRALAPGLSPTKTWAGAAAGLAASVAIGANVGLWFEPPFDVRSGIAFGVGVGVLAPIGDLTFSALKRSAGIQTSGRMFGPLGGALDVVDGLLFAAPAFYWAFRTIAL